MTIKIKTIQTGSNLGEVFVATSSFDQSMWLGKQGWFFFGNKSKHDLKIKLLNAGVPLNSRWLPENQTAIAAKVFGSEGVEFSPRAAELLGKLSAAIEASEAFDSDIEIHSPAGLEYRPYQKAGIAFAMNAFAAGKRGVLFGDEMGLGKTMQAIGCMILTNAAKVLVVCPASLKLNWTREIELWIPGCSTTIIEDGTCDPDARVTILNYEKVVGKKKNAVAVREILTTTRYDLVIFDEGHVLKNEKAQRTKFFFGTYNRKELKTKGLVHLIEKVLVLTGTPIQNKVRESLGLVRALDGFGPAGVAKDEGAYLFRFCGAHKDPFGWNFDGSSRLDELQTKLRSTIMVRRLKADVAKELPPKIRGVITLDCKAPKMDNFIPEDFEGDVEKLAIEVVGFEDIAAVRAAIAEAKAEAVIEHIKTTLEGNGKVIVFSHHKSLRNAIEETFTTSSIRIDGDVLPGKRQGLVDRFQNEDEVTVANLSTKAAGIGLNLTAASIVIVAEADWNPSWCVQAEDRSHRIGQTAEQVTIQYLVADGTLDAHVIQTMIRKMNIADRALDRKVAKEAAPQDSLDFTSRARGPREIILNTRDKAPTTYILTEEKKKAAMQSLLILAGQCDGARARDDIGFNGRDAHSDFVKNLVTTAATGQMSDNQAAWSLKVLETYKNTQLPKDLVEVMFPGKEK
jgi:SWI/SNF-related matrix-associated actin-dependent regulator 1 of chromatin subfamily A